MRSIKQKQCHGIITLSYLQKVSYIEIQSGVKNFECTVLGTFKSCRLFLNIWVKYTNNQQITIIINQSINQ